MARSSEYPIDPMFLERWSPRAFHPEPMSEEALMTMLDAAHWAASSSNAQPWRFLYALRDTPAWDDFVGLLVPFNQEWARNASALVFVASESKSVSPKSGETNDLPTHSFDAGAAACSMVFQALKMGYHTHGMWGFDHERAKQRLRVPDSVRIEAVFAIGKLGDKSKLSQALQEREVPSDRKPLKELVFEGGM